MSETISALLSKVSRLQSDIDYAKKMNETLWARLQAKEEESSRLAALLTEAKIPH
jgi:uncharacterized protein YhaN